MNSTDYNYDSEDNVKVFEDEVNNNDEFTDNDNDYDDGNYEVNKIKVSTVISTDEIVKRRDDIIQEVNEFFMDIPPVVICALLNHVKWDSVVIVTSLYDDQHRLFKNAHVVYPYRVQQDEEDSRKSTENESECQICCTDASVSRVSELICGHQFCEGCLREYFRNKIMEEGRGQGITCAGHECETLVDEAVIMRLVAPDVKVRYQHLLNKSFVECNKYLTRCPAPGCTYVIQVKNSELCEVTCKCGQIFCFACNEIWHDPIDCILFKKWLKKCSDDSESSHWISANTKDCPKCATSIEKHGGCNHMTCIKEGCRYEFCWICLQEWEVHTNFYRCNIYIKDALTTKSDGRKSIERYLHFYNYYKYHHQSLKLEKKLLPYIIQDKIEKALNAGIRLTDTKYLVEATDVLRQCRETLMMTFAFAYYLKRDNHSIIFEDNQHYLQIATEALSGYLETEIRSVNIDKVRFIILEKSNYCERRRKTLLEHVHEGYEKEWWQFTG